MRIFIHQANMVDKK